MITMNKKIKYTALIVLLVILFGIFTFAKIKLTILFIRDVKCRGNELKEGGGSGTGYASGWYEVRL